MKKFTFILFTILLFSCKEKEMTDSEMNKFLDSLDLEDKNINTRKYSIQDENKVIDSIQFGNSQKEFKLKFEKFITKNKRKKSSILIDNEPYIGNYKFTECCFVDLYDDNKLYYLQLRGYPISWENYNTEIEQQINYLKEVIIQQYGNPTKSFEIKNRIDVEKGFTYLVSSWSIQTKRIEIRISTIGTSYSVDLFIYKSDVYEKIEAEEKVETEEATNKAKNTL